MNVPPKDAPRVPVAQLEALSLALLAAAGLPEADARTITDLLLGSDLRGVLSHGTRQLAGYVRAFRDGGLNPRPRIQVVRDDGATALLDGDGGLGHLVSKRAMALAIDKALTLGVGATATRYHGHYGGAGKYTRMAIDRGCVGFSISGHTLGRLPEGAGPHPNPIGNPPMSFAFPAATGPPVVLDMGTSFFDGADFGALLQQVPAALFKSLGLVAVSTLLGGALTGMMAADLAPGRRAWRTAGYGGFFVAVAVDRFVAIDDFRAEADRTVQQLATLPPWPGYERFDLPGALEWERERRWATEGIPLGDDHRRSLEEIAAQVGVAVPWW